MSTLTTVVILFLTSFAFFLFIKKLSQINTFFRDISYSGIGYIILGFILGPKLLDILNREVLLQLDIFIFLILGWAGFLIGLQTSLSGLRRFSSGYYIFSISHFLLAAVLAFVFLYALKQFSIITIGLPYLVFLSIVNACTSPILIGLASKKLQAEHSFLLRFNAAYDNIMTILIYGLLLVYFLHSETQMSLQQGIISFLIMIGATLLTVLIYRTFEKQIKTLQENQLYLVGLLLIVIGLAYFMSQSIILFSFIFGALLANMKVNSKKIFVSIEDLQKPLYILLLLILGAQIEYNINILLLTFLFLIVHLSSNWLSGLISMRYFWSGKPLDKHIGLANLGMGGLTIAFFLELSYLDKTVFAQTLLFLLAATIVVSDLVSSRYFKTIQTK